MITMKNVNISIPNEILLTLRESDKELALNMKRWAALKLFEEKRLSIGQSAELAEMTEGDFIKYLSASKVSIFPYRSYSELAEDVDNA
jgi:predicted HTH domain antitoxin